MNVVVPEPRRAPSMRAFRFLRDSRSSGLFNPVSLCRAISQRLPEPASRRTTGPEDRSRLGFRRGPRGNLADERNESLCRPATCLDTTVRSLRKVGLFYILIVLLSSVPGGDRRELAGVCRDGTAGLIRSAAISSAAQLV
jgi:hypothetical protein